MKKVFLAGFFAFLAVPPLVQIACGPPAPLRLLASAQASNLRAFERQIDQESLFGRAGRFLVKRILIHLREASKVIILKDGVLYYRPDLRYLVEPVSTSEAFGAIVDTHEQLTKRGIRLVVMPVPVKPGGPGTKSAASSLLRDLRNAGVETIDLFGLPREYAKLDTHWTAACARDIAERIAPQLAVPQGNFAYHEREVRIERVGDLAQMIAIPNWVPPETLSGWQVIETASGHLYRDNPEAKVLILGDSFSRVYQADQPGGAGFIAHLARTLRQPLQSIASDGGGAALSRQDLARRPDVLRNKRVVLWEFVERDLALEHGNWSKVTLP